MHDGVDLDPHEVTAQGGCCAWTKWVYFDGFKNMPKEICGEDASKRHGRGFK